MSILPSPCRTLLVLVACLCARVQALPLTDYAPTGSDTLELFISGASAQDNTLERLMRLLCVRDSLDIYRAGGNQRVLFCQLPARAGGIAAVREGQKLAVFKTSVGGSGNGVGPLVDRNPLEFINLADLKAHASARCPEVRRMKHAAEQGASGYTEHQCANPQPLYRVPDAGVSDVEPEVFAPDFGFGPEKLATLAMKSANAFVFGVPVSLKLRNALQAAQFETDNPCHPAHKAYAKLIGRGADRSVPHSESEPCMPSLNKAQIAGIFGGTLSDWSSIVNRAGYPLAQVAQDSGKIVASPGVPPPADSRIFVCRRVVTSGTQASYEMYFLNQRCAADVRPFVKASPTVQLGSGTSDVKFCLKDRDTRNLWAIGLFSTENVAKSDDAWRFIKMNRVAPTLLSAMNGRWDFFVEQTFLWRGDRAAEPLSSVKLLLMDYFAAQAGNPEIIRELNKSFRHSWGDAGVLALSTNGYRPPFPSPGQPLDEAGVRDNPVVALTHAAQGRPTSCGPPLATFPTVAP